MTIQGNETTPLMKTGLPGPNGKKIIRKDDKYVATTSKVVGIVADHARGVVVEDVDGNRFLDFASGIGVLNTGHCHPRIVKAVQDQAARLMHFAGTDFYYSQQADLAERLSEVVPIRGQAKTFFCQSGAEANEASIKVAKQATGRHMFLAFRGGFHGRTMGALGLTASKARQREGFFPTMGGVQHADFPNPFRNLWRVNGYEQPDELTNRSLDQIEEMFKTTLPPDDVAACFWEPVQGEGGYVVPPMGWPRALQKLLAEHGILLVADEVQTGFGRTGKWFASEHFGVQPDIMSLAKAMGSGLPIGASVFRAELDFAEKGSHSNTYGGNLVTCAAALATLDVLRDEELVINSEAMGGHLAKRLREHQAAHAAIGDVRGRGLMQAVEFTTPDGGPDPKTRDRVEQEAWKRGLILLGCGRSGIRFIPPLMVSQGQVDGAMEVFGEALKAAKARTT